MQDQFIIPATCNKWAVYTIPGRSSNFNINALKYDFKIT